jgi:hypothetical protein
MRYGERLGRLNVVMEHGETLDDSSSEMLYWEEYSDLDQSGGKHLWALLVLEIGMEIEWDTWE